MNARLAQRLARRYLLPQLSGFAVRGALTYAKPLGDVARGFYLESSRDPQSFYLWVFVQPLYIPIDGVSFTFGERLGHGWSLSAETEDAVMREVVALVRQEGLPFLAGLRNPADLASRAAAITQAPDDPNVAEAIAYSLLLAGQWHEAAAALARLDRIVRAIDQRRHPWVAQLGARGGQVRDALTHEPTAALALLAVWRAQTVAALRLLE